MKVNSKSTTDDEGKTKEYTEEEKENLKKEVEAFAASAKDDFKAAAETAGYTVSEGSYGKDDETLDKALTEGADKLKEGEISPVLVGEEAFFVARMDSTFDKEATEKKKTEIVEKRQSDHYKEVCDGYKEGVKYEVNEKEWAKVKFDDLFTIKQEEAEDSGEEAGDSEDKETSEDTGEEAGDSDPAEDGEEAQDSDPAEDGEEAGDSKDTEE